MADKTKLNIGDSVIYTNPKSGKDHKGIIHGIQKVEDSKGKVTAINYIIDTGKAVREDVYQQDEHDIELYKQMTKLMDKGMRVDDAEKQVQEKGNLPKRGNKMIEVGRFRQPEQLTVSENDIKPAG